MIRALILTLCLTSPAVAQDITAILEPSRSVELRTTVPGRIAQIVTAEGQQVRAGDIVANMDDAIQAARVALARTISEADGNVVRARAQIVQLEALRDRIQVARSRGAAQAWEVTQANQAVELAQADLRIAFQDQERRRLDLALEEATLAQYAIRAPFDAVVFETPLDIGEVVDAGNVIAAIGDISVLSATAFVPLEWATDLTVGSTLMGEVDASRVSTTVRTIDPRIDPASRTLRIVVELENAAGLYPVGAPLFLFAPDR